jgi:indolepyruvate ferredoxin oxidoreductase alpha subunit
MDVKTSLGASISIAAGISRTFIKQNINKRVIALSGDSSFLHTNFFGLVDAVRIGAQMLILILDNNTTALSGRQPHPGTRIHDQAAANQPLEISDLAIQAGANLVQIVDLDRDDDLRPVLDRGLKAQGVNVIIARGECPGCP